MPLSPARVLKHFGYAMYFDGVDDYVRLSPPPSSSAYTVMLWMSTLGPTGFFQNAFRWDCYSPIIVGWIDFGYRMLCVHAYDGYFKMVVLTDPKAVRGQWIHVTSVVVDNQAIYGYLNNSLRGSASLGTTAKPTGSPMYVGAEDCPGHPAYFFYGYVVQVLVYTRALSDSERAWNYQYPDNPVKDSLVLWLQADPNNVKDVDGDGVLEWVDLSGFNNHGKIYGATLVQLIKPSRRLLPPARVLNVRR
jgi:hypothetical protein